MGGNSGNDAGTTGADRDECCGETANVSPLKAEEPEEVRRIDEDFPCLTEAGLAAELAPDVSGLGKVAGGDVVPDLVPFGRRQYPPQGLVHQHEAVEICDPILISIVFTRGREPILRKIVPNKARSLKR